MAELTEPVPNDGALAVQEHPEEVPTAETAPAYGERNEQLPEQLQNALKNAVKDFQKQEMYDRRREVLRDRRNRFYERGYQHIYEDSRSGGFTQGTPGGIVNAGGREIQCPNYIDDYNIFAPCLEILIAILTQNPPGIDFRPNQQNRVEDMEAAQTAEGYRKLFDCANDIKQLQTEIVRMLGVSGRTVIWTRTEADAQKFGLNNDDGSPKQMETATVYGTLESKVPITAREAKNRLYCFLSGDIDVKIAKTEHPAFAKKIKAGAAGLGESAYERIARLGVLQGTRGQAQIGDALTHLVTRMHCWLRPAAFAGEMYDDPLEAPEDGDLDENGQPLTVKEKLEQLFPSGCHVVFVGDVYVGSWDESMDDALTIGFPYPGDGMSRQAMMDRGVVVQDRYNDDRNAYAECKDCGWPSTWVNGDETDIDSIAEQKADPYAIRIRKARSTMPMAQEFFREPDPSLPSTFVADTEGLLNLLYFMLATPPALFGQAETDQKTASGFAQMRAQAMGRLGLAWGAIQRMLSRVYYQAALAAAKNPDHGEEIVVPAEGGQGIALRLSRLTKGKFGAHPDEDSSFPESTAAKRATLTQIVTMAAQSPVGAQLFSSPDNWELFKQLLGFPELDLPEATARNKQAREIELLLEQSPIPPSEQELEAVQTAHAAAVLSARISGQPERPPLKMVTIPNEGGPAFSYPEALLEPSVPVEDLDFHAWEGKKGQEWLSSEACWRERAAQNLKGILNVKLHTLEHLKRAALESAPPPLPMPAAKPPGPEGELGAPNAISAPPGAPGAPTM
ncbi:MAG: hypothetical protein ACRD19_14975 [Terriglobia bacterium]